MAEPIMQQNSPQFYMPHSFVSVSPATQPSTAADFQLHSKHPSLYLSGAPARGGGNMSLYDGSPDRAEDEGYSRNPNMSAVLSASPPRINILRNLEADPILEKDYSVPEFYANANNAGPGGVGGTQFVAYRTPNAGSNNVAANAEQSKKREFLDSLKEQIRLKEWRKKMEKQRQLEEDRRITAEEQEYQYFGKGGAGGVKKDFTGHTIAVKKFDPSYVSNLYGRETYNRSPGPVIPRPPPEADVLLPNPNTELLSRYHKIKLQEELNQELAIERRLKEEQRRREILTQQLEEERVRREREELRLKFMQEQEENARKRAGSSAATTNKFVSRLIQSRANARKELSMTAVQLEPSNNEVVSHKTNVKMQTNMEPIMREGEMNTKEFVRQLPEKVKIHVNRIVDSELTRLMSEMRSQESRVMDNILSLKKEINDSYRGKDEAVQQIIALRNEVKRLKQDDLVRYNDVYTTLIKSVHGRTKFEKPAKESSRLDQYKAEQHRFFLKSPQTVVKKEPRHHSKVYRKPDLMDMDDNSDDSIEVHRISSPPEAGNSAYFERVRKKNQARLQQLAQIERKNKGFYEMVDDFIQKDQLRISQPKENATVRPTVDNDDVNM